MLRVVLRSIDDLLAPPPGLNRRKPMAYHDARDNRFLFNILPGAHGLQLFTLSVMASAYAHLSGLPANKNHKILQAMNSLGERTHLVK
jgi:hypothetical protein